MGNILGVGITGLNAAQAGLVATEHNIANASTPGYHRQEIIQAPQNPQLTGSGFFGQGVQVQTVNRIYSDFLDKQVQQAQTTGSYLDAYYSQIKQIDNLMSDPNVGLSPAMQDFFNGVQELANNPSSVPVRQSLLGTANTLVNRFSSLNQRLTEIRSGVNSQLSSVVTEINSYAKQISALNGQITIATTSSSGTGQLPNDLLDQRDQLISELNKLVKVTALPQTDGSYNIFIGNGQPLVVGATTFSLTATQSKEDPDNIVVGYGGNELTSSLLSGGSLTALLDFRSTSLDAAQNALGRVATALAQSFNDQQKLGMDLNGVLGTSFFNVGSNSPQVSANTGNNAATTVTIGAALSSVGALTTDNYRINYTGGASPYSVTNLTTNTTNTYTLVQMNTANTPVPGLTLSVSAGTINVGDQWLVMPTRYAARDISVAINDTSLIAAAAPIKTLASTGAASTAKISAGTVNAPPPTNANLLQPVTITFTSATAFDVSGMGTGNPTGVTYTTGGNITYNGWTVQISGTPAAGDVFTIQSNSGGVSDGRNALALAALQTANTMVNNAAGSPTTTFQGAYSQMVSTVGNKTREMQVRSTAQNTLIQQTTQEQQALSGVNLDEEAAKMLRYQQAYQAAGKAMQVATSLFQTLLDIGR